jgi:hypothetical protein
VNASPFDRILRRAAAVRFLLPCLLLSLLLPAVSAVAEGEKNGETAGEEAEHANTLKWATASEVDNFGYDVYRGESEEGPFERITEQPIPGAGTTDEPSYYKFVDEEIDPHRDYYYYVESISIHGDRERFTPVRKVPAKVPAEEPGESGEESEQGG